MLVGSAGGRAKVRSIATPWKTILRRKRPVRAFDLCGQATKGAWGMSWRQEALKGVEDCEKLGVTVKRVMIPRFPNGRMLNS